MYTTLARIKDNLQKKEFKEVYKIDVQVQRVLEEVPQNFIIDKQGIIRFQGLVYIPKACCKRFVLQQHTLSTWGYQGVTRIQERLAKDYYFPSIQSRIVEWLKECDECNQAKVGHYKLYRLLQLLPTPTRPNKVVTIDFIIKLPKLKDPIIDVSYNLALVLVDQFTKFAKFVLQNKNQLVEKLVYIVLRYIIVDYNLLDIFVIDWDRLFILKFWQTLLLELGVYQRNSIVYHLQTNGQTEQVNQILEIYL